jgi:hypothetical protein
MTRLETMRMKAQKIMMGAIAALSVVFVLAALFISPTKALAGGLILAAITGLVFVAWRANPSVWTTRALFGAAMMAFPACMTFLMMGRPWQIDMHMLFFAALAAVTILCDWRALLAAAGAAEVVAVEPRAELLARLPQFPNPAWRARIRPVQAEAIDHLETALRAGERFDFAAVFGLFYHIMDHNRLLLLLRRLGARLIVIDGEFLQPANPMIQMVREATAKPLNAAPQFPGQAMTFKGVPSIGAIQAMAEALEYDLDWFPWDALPPADRGPVGDYFRPGRMRRATCVLRRRAGPDQEPARDSHASSQ